MYAHDSFVPIRSIPTMALRSRISKTFTGIVLLAVVSVTITVAAPGYPASIPSDQREIHVLNRLGFGPRREMSSG
jgi:hypothetical protein